MSNYAQSRTSGRARTSQDRRSVAALLAVLVAAPSIVLVAAPTATAAVVPGPEAIYTDDEDFDLGRKINVDHYTSGELQLNDTLVPFPFIWIAVSSKGTVVKLSTRTGTVLGEYKTSPDGTARNPSRTTVDLEGSVWVANRDESGSIDGRPMGSVVHIALKELGNCEDRNGNGVIDTSTGLGDVREWTNAGGADTRGGVSTALDECVLHYTRVHSTGTRHVSVTPENNVWVSGSGIKAFDLLSGETGEILRSESSVDCGGYGGLIDRNGVIWSARPLLRWDTKLPLTPGNYQCWSHDSYGLCIDSRGNVWETSLYNNVLRKWAPDGTLLGTFNHGNYHAQGCAVDRNDHVWVAHSLLGPQTTVGHVNANGRWIGNVGVASGPTGVSVDSDGKVWVAAHSGQVAQRIDPAAGSIGADGVTRVGSVDLTSVGLGGSLYNYSDMTGSGLLSFGVGSWQIVHDGLVAPRLWRIDWTSKVVGDGSLVVTASGSADGVRFASPEEMINGLVFSKPGWRFLKVTVKFTRATTGESPILHDLSVVAVPIGSGGANALWAGSTAPASLEYNTGLEAHSATGASERRVASADVPALGLLAKGLAQRSSVLLTDRGASAAAGSEAAEVRLLSGAIVLTGLANRVEATYDRPTLSTTLTTSRTIGSVEILGQRHEVDPQQGTQTFDLPDGGRLVLFESARRETPFGVAYEETLARLYAPLAHGRIEVIVGSINVEAGLIPFPRAGHFVLGEDDARSGRDAGSTRETAIRLLPGLYDGALAAEDGVDLYAVDLLDQNRMRLELGAAPRAAAEGGAVSLDAGGPAATPPDAALDPVAGLVLKLYDPAGKLRGVSSAPHERSPQKLDFNADAAGTWIVAVARAGAAPARANYSLLVAPTYQALLPEELDGVSFGDAPDTCAGTNPEGPSIGMGTWTGSLPAGDRADHHQFFAEAGSYLQIALKPGEEADGVVMRLALHDDECGLVGTENYVVLQEHQSRPQLLFIEAPRSGRYVVGVEQVDGVGNYYLAMTVGLGSGGSAASGGDLAGAQRPGATIA